MLTGAVLTGGASRRMGRNKALVEVGGTPMALLVADTLSAAGCEPVVLVGGDPARLAALGLRVVPDGPPARGRSAACSPRSTGGGRRRGRRLRPAVT